MKDLIRKGADGLETEISEEQISDFITFYDEINKWGKKINLTALLNNKEKLVEELFLDSMAPLKIMEGTGNEDITLLDIGSGGGFPGIPIKIINRSIIVTLSDSIEKKVFFMRNVIRALSLDKTVAANVKYGEAGAPGLNKLFFDFAVSKAVATADKLGIWAAPHLKKNGRLICMKSEGEALIRLNGYREPESFPYTLPLSGIKRKLIVYVKE
ncbi:MAG: 16S rRNA (guanine(527)-N(7))-methyltransferase RsmG [bacterium]|nr:16S rRNA (guanine(527)-N(7))-methyltransferase RsmG [bacterium]